MTSRARACGLLMATGLSVAACRSGSDAGVTNQSSLPISTSSWKPGDPGADALIRGTLTFERDGCAAFEPHRSVVWPAEYTSVVKPTGEHVIVTADGREIAAGDTVVAGGGIGNAAPAGMPCVRPGSAPTYIESEVRIVRAR